MPLTPGNQQRLLELCRNKNNKVEKTNKHLLWYSRIEPDGSQLWACVWMKTKEIRNGGLNKYPRPFDPKTGYNRPIPPRN